MKNEHHQRPIAQPGICRSVEVQSEDHRRCVVAFESSGNLSRYYFAYHLLRVNNGFDMDDFPCNDSIPLGDEPFDTIRSYIASIRSSGKREMNKPKEAQR